MYCNQCGYEMKDSANFCKKCGAPVDDTDGDLSEGKRRVIRFLYTYKSRILLCVIGALLLCGMVIGAAVLLRNMGTEHKGEKKAVIPTKSVSSVDLKDSYVIEDNRLILGPLYASYDDSTTHELMDYAVSIDAVSCEVVEGVIDATDLYDGKHLVTLEWKQGEKSYEFEKTVSMEHKKDTWEKYEDLTGMTGKEIEAAYGELGALEFGSFQAGNWGYAYGEVRSLSIQACFPVGIFHKQDKEQVSDVQCIEMIGTLNTFFYNLETEMNLEDLEDILGLTLTELEGGGCSGTLSNGKLIYIGQEQVQDGVYTPETTVKITLSDEEKGKFWERIF